NTIFYPMYGGGINLLPEIAFFMSVDSALGDTIDVNVVEANDIVSNIYPNPSKDQLFVELKNEGKASIQLFNILGQEVKNISTLDNKTQVNVSDLKAGIYIVRVKQNNKVFTSKITIQ
ncbi:MAG: T9SS type A sorting domain-containing protein, partial [Bacteroidales bacterium]|nr:T9SS type A sorting domain-containing protein [Bacteroidales bacterium]